MKYEHDSLIHYGIKGQHWGVRNYQNPDGSLTEAGKQRYSSGSTGKLKEESTESVMRDAIEAVFPKMKEKCLAKASKELEEKGVRDRFDDQDLDHYSKCSNQRFRNQVVNDMSKNPKLKYRQAYRRRMLKNIGIWAGVSVAAMFAVPAAIKYGSKAKAFIEANTPRKVNLLNVENRKTRISNIPYNVVKDNKGDTHYAPAMKF